jgi:type II secretory pathway pseudopilin PulG
MKLIRNLISRNRTRLSRLQKIRGLSTAELVGIIVIVGILGALGGTYITGLVSSANTNTLAQNAASLNSVYASAVAGGAGTTAGVVAANNIDTTSNTTAIADLNNGVIVSGVTYQMSPKIVTPASYDMTASPSGTYVFSVHPGATTP